MTRHGLSARIIHAVALVAIVVLLASGLALSDHLPASVVKLLGGHVVVDDLHRQLGLVVTLALVVMVLVATTQICRLLYDVTTFTRSDLQWPTDFVGRYIWPKDGRPAHHGGHFDPGQRVVFIGIIGSVAILGATGVYIYVAPAFPTLIMAWTLRFHTVSGWVLVVCVVVHILAGSGVLPTHRGVARAMFGSGRVDQALADRLWPAWAQDQDEPPVEGSNGDEASASDEFGAQGGTTRGTSDELG